MIKTPIMLITGSLGSGKTTLLRRILQVTPRKLAIFMNEFGEVAIDSKVIRGDDVQIVELAGGCVCCSMTGEFEAAVKEVLRKVRPEFLVVEATGVSEVDALVFEVEENLAQVRIDSVICVVDAFLSLRHPHVGYTARTHLQAADVVLVNKIDLVTTDEVKEVESQVRLYNASALLFKTVGCDVDPHLLFGLDVERRVVRISPHGEADFQSFTYSTDALLDEDKFRQVISGLGPLVFRAKGFVRFPGVNLLFNYVLGRMDLEEFGAPTTQLVFIGRDLDEERESILAELRECEVPHGV